MTDRAPRISFTPCPICLGPKARTADVCAVCHLVAQLSGAGLPVATREYRFAPPRRWRFDLAWPPLHLALEVEGGTWITGRHSRGVGYERDLEKYNAATLLGWKLLRCTSAMVQDGRALAVAREALDAAVARISPSAPEPHSVHSEGKTLSGVVGEVWTE